MQVVWSWLKELCELSREVAVDEAAAALTGAGLEVESVAPVGAAPSADAARAGGAGFWGVVLAQVVGKRPHPNADRLTLVDVIDRPGGAVTEVVCGANNVPDPGGLVLWAKPGAVLPGGPGAPFEIATRKLKGVTSHGMLCSEDEIGLGDDHSGIVVIAPGDAPADGLGAAPLLGDPDALQRLGLADWVLDIGVPANRADALGHLGIARELCALLGGTVRFPDIELGAVTDPSLRAEDLVTIEICDPDGCPRYVARVIDGVRVGPSPLWMRQRLRAVGVRPLSNLVDVTNYVMFELGQPQHAFDWHAVHGEARGGGGEGAAAIVVRRARHGETMTTLDGVERKLVPGELIGKTLTELVGDLLICDDERAIALAGVMGGADTEVTDATTRVLLETANFDPLPIRETARRLGLHSEASHRFERGVDPGICADASARAALLLARMGGGRVAAGLVDACPRASVLEPARVSVRASRASLLAGVSFDRDAVAANLARLGIVSAAGEGPAGEAGSTDDGDTLVVSVPTYRRDLEREADLIEEVIRVHGIDEVPATLPSTQLVHRAPSRPHAIRAAIRRALTACGFSEAISYGFTSRERVGWLRLPDGADDPRARPLPLRNPMSEEQAVMRTSLVPGLLAAVARNASFGISDVALFEIGSVFFPRGEGELPDEPVQLAGVLSGHRPGWLMPGAAVDFFDIKGALDVVLAALLGRDVAVSFERDENVPYMHPGVCAGIYLASRDGGAPRRIGQVGEIHPATRDAAGLDAPCFAFDLTGITGPGRPVTIDLIGLADSRRAAMQEIPKFPAITRDVSFFVDAEVPAARVRALIDEAREPLIERVQVLEDYREPGRVPDGQKGMLWSLVYRSPDTTLTDAEVDAIHERVVASLLSELGATRR